MKQVKTVDNTDYVFSHNIQKDWDNLLVAANERSVLYCLIYNQSKSKYIWRDFLGHGMAGYHSSIERAIEEAENFDFTVKQVTQDDFQ